MHSDKVLSFVALVMCHGIWVHENTIYKLNRGDKVRMYNKEINNDE